MSKTHRLSPSSSGTSGPEGRDGSGRASGGPKTIESLGMETLNWAARELGVPIEMIIKVLKQDPSLIDDLATTAKGPKQTEKPPASAKQTPEKTATPESQIPGLIVDLEAPQSRLFIPQSRPLCCQIPGSQSVRTPGMFTIEIAEYDIRIYNSSDQQITRIWGDPHVNENGGGDDWHFGNDSTFILPDGVKLCLDTKEVSPGVWLVQGVDVIGGNDRFHFGVGDTAGLHKDGKEWDKNNADAALDDSAGVFAMTTDGTWAKRAPDGHFYDVQDESWSDYLKTGDVTHDPNKRVNINGQQQHAQLHDTLPDWVSEPQYGEWEEMPEDKSPRARMTLREPERRAPFIKYPDSKLIETPLGYTIEMKNDEVFIWNLEGKPVTRIWGDPHVNENGKADATWHFGEKSTFILPDGTKIALNTEQNQNGMWFVVGVDIVQSHTRFHYGVGDEAGMTEDGREWDKANTDRSNSADAGVFALAPSGEWAVMGKDGHFYDVQGETWSQYLEDPDIDLDPKTRVQITRQQNYASKSDFMPAGMQMSFIGEAHPSEIPQSKEEAKAARQALLAVMPASHFAVIESAAPKIIPALAADLVLAQFVGDMPITTLRHLMVHAPQLILDPGEKQAPPGAIWPRPEVTGRKAEDAADPWWSA